MTPPEGSSHAVDMTIPVLRDKVMISLRARLPPEKAKWMPRGDVAKEAKQAAADYLAYNRIELNLLDQRDLVTALINGFFAS